MAHMSSTENSEEGSDTLLPLLKSIFLETTKRHDMDISKYKIEEAIESLRGNNQYLNFFQHAEDYLVACHRAGYEKVLDGVKIKDVRKTDPVAADIIELRELVSVLNKKARQAAQSIIKDKSIGCSKLGHTVHLFKRIDQYFGRYKFSCSNESSDDDEDDDDESKSQSPGDVEYTCGNYNGSTDELEKDMLDLFLFIEYLLLSTCDIDHFHQFHGLLEDVLDDMLLGCYTVKKICKLVLEIRGHHSPGLEFTKDAIIKTAKQNLQKSESKNIEDALIFQGQLTTKMNTICKVLWDLVGYLEAKKSPPCSAKRVNTNL